eukprot:g2178.t1
MCVISLSLEILRVMKTPLVLFATLAILCDGFTSLQGNGFTTAQDSSSFEAFLRKGFHALTGVSTTEATLAANAEKCKDAEKVYEVTCNGAPLDTDSCVGRTMVNVTTTCEDNVEYYTRMCDGKFVNETIPSAGNMYNMNTVQTCYGKSFVMMKWMKKDASSGEWKKTFFYSKTCFPKYIIKQEDSSYISGTNYEITTHCETTSETTTVKPEDEHDSDLEGAIVTCNCEAADINKPCEGRLKIVTNKMMKPPANKNGKDKKKKKEKKKKKKGSKKGSSPSPSPSPATEPEVTPSEAPPLSPAESSSSPKPLEQSISPSIAKPPTTIEEKPVAPPLATPVSSPESVVPPPATPVSSPESSPDASLEEIPVSSPEPVAIASVEAIPVSSPESVVPPPATPFSSPESSPDASLEEIPVSSPEPVAIASVEAIPVSSPESVVPPPATPVSSPESSPDASLEEIPVSSPEPVAPPLATPVYPPDTTPSVSPEVLPSPAVQTEPSTSVEVESPSTIEEEPFIAPEMAKTEMTKMEMEKTWTFICDGEWKPYGSAYYECVGKKQEIIESYYYNSSKNCTGMFGTGMFEGKKGGYKICSGKSDFHEVVVVPAFSPPTYVF